MSELRIKRKENGMNTLIGLIASNDEAQIFYKKLQNVQIKDEGVWIEL